MADTQVQLTDSMVRRNRIYATSGVVIEWYDFMIYGLLATSISAVFYPSDNPTVSLILTFATFAVGYLARPIGGIVLGRLGDTRGRKFALVLSTTLMLIPLFIITILPGYDSIGIWAPILLTLMRLMQGFSVGGEYTGALTALSESGDASVRGRSVSLGLATAMGGNLLASLVVLATTLIWGQAALDNGTWRIPYAIGFVLAIVSVYLQRKMRETTSFEETKDAGKTGQPLSHLVRTFPVATILMLALAAWSGVTVYTLVSWLPSYLQTVVGYSEAQADASSAFISIVYILTVMPIAVLGDRLGRRRIMFYVIAGYALLAIPAYLMLSVGGVALILISMAVLAIMQAFVDSTTTTEMTTLVPTRVRYTGLALTYSLGMIIGSFTPAFEESIVAATGSVLVPAVIVIAISLVLVPVVLVLPRYVARATAAEA